ncbi:MAG: hydrogenase 3 maturation endopeptidase HyCI [Planctomycetota bacterium]|jgi:hydrogenase 3 maturation protease
MAGKEQILEQLKILIGSNTLIVGIGQILKGDDGIGPLLCEKLNSKISAEIIEAGTVPENYIQPIVMKAPQNLLIIDAIDFGAEPGQVRLFLPENLSSAAFSTHSLSPRLFINLIKEQIDVNVYLLGIQPAQLKFGQPLSEPVNIAMENIIEILVEIFPPR